jgi:hypothetical protein
MARGSQGGKSNNPHGRPKGIIERKRNEWEEMGRTITGEWTDALIEYGNMLLSEGKYEEFSRLYLAVVNYFKPKLSSAQLQAKADINIQVKEPDWGNEID